MAAKSKPGPFRQAMFKLAVRNHLADQLVRDHGYSRRDAREATRELSDEVIEEGAVRVAGAPKAIGDGGILQFLLDFLASPQFAQLIALLLSLFTGPKSGPTQVTETAEQQPA